MSAPAVLLDGVTVTYDGAARPALRDVDLVVPEGELVLVVGGTGSGKSTLLRTVNGLVPHFTGGTLAGRVLVGGRDTRTHRPRDLADVVGVVAQDPATTFVTDTVEDELAYGLEVLGVPPAAMRRRVEETLDLLGLDDLRERRLGSLSGGQAQRVAIGAVLAAGPRVLVLDEPTSALDPVAAEDVLASITRLVHDLGLTVLVAEHRLERVVHHADHVVLVEDGRASGLLHPAEAMARSRVHPPVVALGRLAGWRPLPLSVRDARRHAEPLREALSRGSRPTGAAPASHPTPPAGARPAPARPPTARPSLLDRVLGRRPPAPDPFAGAVVLDGVRARRGDREVLRGVDLTVGAGEVVALMGRNGVGKSTLLDAALGRLPVTGGTVRTLGLDPASLSPARRLRVVGLVPQDASSLLHAETVAAELAQADADAGATAGATEALHARLRGEPLGALAERHPRDLSEGQRLLLALAVVLVADPPVLLLDEPTRGLDYPAKARLVDVLRELSGQGHAVVVATHDVELAAEGATRAVLLAQGEVIADGPSREVLCGSPAFAPQVAKVLAPLPVLTVDDVARALGGGPR